MSRSRQTSNPISYHKWTKQFYVTRAGRRIYLGSDEKEALKKYHQLGIGFESPQSELSPVVITVKELSKILTAPLFQLLQSNFLLTLNYEVIEFTNHRIHGS